MFRAIFLICLAINPILYFLFFRENLSLIKFGAVSIFLVVAYILFSWVTSQKAKSYAVPFDAYRDTLFDFLAIFVTNNMALLWLFLAEKYIKKLSETEFWIIEGYYFLLFLVTLIEGYLTVSNSLPLIRKSS